MNYFAYPSAAERYARGRPYFHPLAVERIGAICCPNRRLARALDVGCGTGQSTLAVAAVAEAAVGVDASAAMLSQTEDRPGVAFAGSSAEALPFADASFDLVTAGMAFHWFDHDRFLSEAARVLKPGGWLAIYNDHFSSEMIGNPDYGRWNREQYVPRYPPPPRNSEPLSDDDARAHDFARVGHDTFRHTADFTPQSLVAYLVTQSNVIAAAESGRENIREIADWLAESVRPLFRGERAAFVFRCVIDVFRLGETRKETRARSVLNIDNC